MSTTKNKKPTFLGFIAKQILLAIGLSVVILIVVLVWLRQYTQHGIEVEVPQVTGLYLEEAQALLESQQLRLVVIDSTYSHKVPLGTIVEQNPPALSHAKHDRAIYVIINAQFRKQYVLPELHDVSYRQAENMLRSMGVLIEDVQYEPSEYRDLILDIRQDEQSLHTGDRISEGSSVILIVGQGQGSEMITVPDLIGMPLDNARSVLLDSHLTIKTVMYDEPPLSPPSKGDIESPTKDNYIVYKQVPQSGQWLLEGSGVSLYLTQDIEKTVTEDNEQNEDDFF